MPVCTHQINSM